MPFTVTRGPALLNESGNFLAFSSEHAVTRPDSVKRVKPPDLGLRHMTNRTVIDSTVNRVIYKPYSWAPNLTYSEAGFEKSHNPQYALGVAANKLRAKIKNEASNLAVFSAEFRQSVDLFRSLAGELYQGYRAIRRGQLGAVIRDLSRDKGFSKKWIEFQFGLVPLVSDLVDTCDGLAQSLRDGLTIGAKSSANDMYVFEREYRDAFGNLTHHYERHDINVRLTAEYTVSNESLRNVTRFGFTNAASFGWELVPFSFVVDYVIDVGGWLSNLDSLVGVQDLYYRQGILTKSAAQLTHGDGKTATTTVRFLQRSGPGTSLTMSLPRWDPSDSYKKVINGLALLRLLGRS